MFVMRNKMLATLFLLVLPGIALSDTWTVYYSVEKVQPLQDWNGGMVRILPASPVNPAGCSNTVAYDFLFDSGTKETRTVVLSAIYIAIATKKEIRFFIDATICSPANAPVIRGAEIRSN